MHICKCTLYKCVCCAGKYFVCFDSGSQQAPGRSDRQNDSRNKMSNREDDDEDDKPPGGGNAKVKRR